MKKASSLRCLLLMLCCMAVCVTAGAATFTVDGINYKSSGTKVTVQKYTTGSEYSGDIVIPETVTYDGTTYTVTATAANSFLNCTGLTSVSLPSTCVTIGRNSFKGCTALTESPIPATATSVGSGVFNGCTSLEEVTIVPGWNKPISEEFANCSSLKRLIFAEGTTDCVMMISAFGTTTDAQVALKTVEYIYMGRNVDASKYTNAQQPFHNMTALKTVEVAGNTSYLQTTVFLGCTALNSVTFESGMQLDSIGSYAFSGCTALPSINIPTTVTEVRQSTFYNCKSLATVTMGSNVTSIGATAFYNTALTSVAWPTALTSIGVSAFQKSKLTGALTLPSALKYIGSQAFAETNLTSISIPATVTSIGSAAFAPIETLAAITVASGNTSFKMDGGVLLSYDGTRLLVSAHEGNIGTTYTNNTVQSIDNYGLAYAPFTSVALGSLTSIGDYGFAYSDLEGYTLGDAITVGIYAFAGSAIEEMEIEESRNEIPQGLCYGCTNLTYVYLPSTATSMMKDCFGGCTALETMTIPANVNYMEAGSVPSTIKTLRVLNPNTPVLAAGVFTEDQSDVTCHVATSSVSDYKAAAQWCYLNIVGDASISGEGASLGCPTGLYFATTDGDLMYKDEQGNIINTGFNAGAHAFTLQSYKNRIYVADAGEKYTYQDSSQPLGDGSLFYVNNSDGIFYKVTVLNNVGGAPSEDPFTMFIDETTNLIYISDRNVGVHKMDADTVGLYGSQPFLFENNWLPYYNDEISWGAITGGFQRDSHGIYWMSKKFNGLCLLRFTDADLYSDGGAGKTKSFNALFKDVIIKTFYIDETNGYLYMHVQKDAYGSKPGIYRIALSKIEDMTTGADVEGNDALTIADCDLIDSSPIKVSGTENSGEIPFVSQITGDGNYIYWGYVAPASDSEAISGSDALDTTNPLHKSGIKCISAVPDASGNMSSNVMFAVEDVEVYGLCGATYVEDESHTKGDVNHDGVVNISDVTALIDRVLADKQMDGVCDDCSDVNSDGSINISDVTALIDLVLTGK